MLTDYLEAAMRHAEYKDLGDEGWYGRIPGLEGLGASAPTREEIESELRSALEDWVLVGLRLGHDFPVVDGIDLNVRSIDSTAKKQVRRKNGFVARADQALIGIIASEGTRDIVRYFTDDAAADEATNTTGVERALSLAGAWKELGEWTEVEQELDRIRHANPPTPPIEL
jgi:predicted RNase H-like HicB family nuclease